MGKIEISVIIPAYNAEKYLKQAIDSVLSQTMDSSLYEIIVVNDGSTDNTLQILNTYKESNENFVIIDKKNEGVSVARNTGLDVSQGKYIYFFDADDILEKNALQSMLDTMKNNNADLVIAKYDIFDQYKYTEIHGLDNLVVQDDIDRYDLDIINTFALWNKMFRKNLIEKLNLRFAPVSYSEDGIFLMEYVYHCKKITGLDETVLHYRRFYDATASSITSSVSFNKIKDYIFAHDMIAESAKQSFMRDFPIYENIETAMRENKTIHRYINTIYQKELKILINRFYFEFWKLSETEVKEIVNEIQRRFGMMDMYAISTLQKRFPELSLPIVSSTSEEVLKNAKFTAVLYGQVDNQEKFLECLNSLNSQTMIFMKIVLPASMEAVVEKARLGQKNIIYVECSSEDELYKIALQQTTTPYIIFCSPEMIYSKYALRRAYLHFATSYMDFISFAVYNKAYGEIQPMTLSRIAGDVMGEGQYINNCLCIDGKLSNKIFRVEYLRSYVNIEELLSEHCWKELFSTGYCKYIYNGSVIYNGSEKEFEDYIKTQETKGFIEEYMQDKPVSLRSPELEYNPAKSGGKFRLLEDTELEYLIPFAKKMAKEPLKNQVLFLSVRADGKLEGNAKALYPYIKGKKVVCSQRLPHNKATAKKMTQLLLTSKVIVTDDYVKYLRYFPLRQEQRVVQIWHACGAFKKFGQRGTNIALPVDRATHAQYNLVCVSGEEVRSVYSDAFDVEYRKVKALGCPRTDVFFDQKYLERVKRKIFLRHPSLKGKSIIIYAPTFRDVGCDRREFHPELDFDRLSRELLPNQMLLICPHPVMKNQILPKRYPNIRVMRDFSTNDYMIVSDKMITDYSSVIFEYALLKKPIAFFCYDFLTYDRGFYLNYPDDLPGEMYETQDELMSFITDTAKESNMEKQNKFVSKYMSACDGHSCERIADLINSYMRGE